MNGLLNCILFLITATTIFSILLRFLSRIFSPLLNKFKLILMNSLSVLNKLYMRKNKLINIILYLFLGIISYNFLYDLTSIKFIKILIFTLISLGLSMYITDNYIFSQNIYIKILQKLIFLILLELLIIELELVFKLILFILLKCKLVVLFKDKNLFKILTTLILVVNIFLSKLKKFKNFFLLIIII